MTEKTKDQDAGLLGNTAGADSQSLTPRREAERIDRLFQLAISAVRCDGSTPTGSYRDTIESALLAAETRGAVEELRSQALLMERCYTSDVFGDPKPVDDLTDEEKLERSRNSAAMGRHIAVNWLRARADELAKSHDEAQDAATRTDCITEQHQKSHQP